MVTTYLQHITNNVDTRDPIGSKKDVCMKEGIT